MVFEVWADGTRIHQSAQLGGASATVSLDLPIATTTQELRLVVTIGNNTANYDHADWADAKIVCGGTSSDTTPPTITARTPTPGASGIAVNVSPTATFSEAMSPATLSTTTVTLVKGGTTTPVAATVAYTGGVVTLDPSANLDPGSPYTATVRGGASGAKDLAGNALASDVTWTFTTAAAANLPPVAAIAANPGSGPAPLAVNFTAAGSSDPEGGALTYAWDLDNDGAFDDGTGLTRSFTYPTPGSITVTVRATDPAGLTDTESTVVTVTGAGQTTRYLSDLATSGTPLNGWGPFERDRSNGEQGAADGLPLTLAGVTYAKGLGIHAASDLRFPIGGGCTAFSAKIGIDDEVGNQGGVVFEVWADGTRIHQSAQLGGASATVSLDLPIATTTQELRLVVTIGNNTANYDHADWADAKIVCGTNAPPVPVITAPTASTTWQVGTTISFAGGATDPEDGTLAASALSWALVMQHCPSNCHSHAIQSWPGVASGAFDAPDHEYPSYLELVLTATDSAGLSASTTLRLDPETVDLTFATAPAGLAITLNGTVVSPSTPVTVIVGSRVTVATDTPQTSGGTTYVFDSWSDGGAAVHDIVAPATDTTYTATFVAQ